MVLSGEFGLGIEVCEDERAVKHLCLEFWEMEDNFKRCVSAMEKNCKRLLPTIISIISRKTVKNVPCVDLFCPKSADILFIMMSNVSKTVLHSLSVN